MRERTHEQVLVKLEQCGWIGDRKTKTKMGKYEETKREVPYAHESKWSRR